jgi:alpha,alpha-trehalase
MYGWDSYFIAVGLLRQGRVEAARRLTDNFLYEVQQYGTVLNANRTYYLTRSQPPLLSRMVLEVYERTRDLSWLRRALPLVEASHEYWMRPEHQAGTTGLARYFDFGEGPAPEVVSSERDERGATHYDRAREYYRTHDVEAYDESLYYDSAHDRLTPLFFKGDRSMRESGFDPSDRFGPLGVDVIHYAPVCLNVLLAVTEQDLATMARITGRSDEASRWMQRAAERKARIDRYLWDEEAGLYFDYHFPTGRRRRYEFATTFYPLWAGLASARQAERVVLSLARFETAHGLLTSLRETGSQWDAPYGWAPLHLFAVRGLRRYGHDAEARRVARKFVALVSREFDEHDTIVEKYDVRRGTSSLRAGLRFGYTSNEVGFGWTNGVVLELLALLEGRDGSPQGRLDSWRLLDGDPLRVPAQFHLVRLEPCPDFVLPGR